MPRAGVSFRSHPTGSFKFSHLAFSLLKRFVHRDARRADHTDDVRDLVRCFFMGTVSPISEGPAHPIFPVLIVNESGSALATTSQYVHALAYETTAPSLKNEAGWPVHR
jgi:hypothetical protein